MPGGYAPFRKCLPPTQGDEYHLWRKMATKKKSHETPFLALL
ncbi:Hypothetical protein Minf_2316 [Methylacidiphilum infernorum V4]|uniref:Uncharacterized protein n=1 Tax=Methylacidiphilum infernorum (isolate V4) TaxID=481448 RepID=B3E0E1_METI4|nr:Hypothetical protein Minf_2316 [Methylacidiphilum infernorum V4]